MSSADKIDIRKARVSTRCHLARPQVKLFPWHKSTPSRLRAPGPRRNIAIAMDGRRKGRRVRLRRSDIHTTTKQSICHAPPGRRVTCYRLMVIGGIPAGQPTQEATARQARLPPQRRRDFGCLTSEVGRAPRNPSLGGGGRAECDGRSEVVVCAVLSASQGFPLRTAVYSQLFRWGQRTLQLAFRLGTADATVWPGWP